MGFCVEIKDTCNNLCSTQVGTACYLMHSRILAAAILVSRVMRLIENESIHIHGIMFRVNKCALTDDWIGDHCDAEYRFFKYKRWEMIDKGPSVG
jgi:hypothetical protein